MPEPDDLCQDSGPSGPLCYLSICFGDTSRSDCVASLNGSLSNACLDGCQSELYVWLSCLAGLPRVCGKFEVDGQCGVAAATLKQCCPACTDMFMP